MGIPVDESNCHWRLRNERMPSKVKHTLAEAMTLMQVEKGVKALEKTIRRLVRHG